MRKIYLDNGSTSFPKAPGVGDAVKNFIEQEGCNLGRGGYEMAYDLADKVFETRTLLAELFGFRGAGGESSEKNVILVPSVTYALNFIIEGMLKPGDHVIISSMEHNAVARPVEAAGKAGVEVTAIACDSEGYLDPSDVGKAIRPNTKLIVMALASNVSGSVQDGEAIGKIAKEACIPFVLDAAQAAGAVDIDFERYGLSGLCVPGHKGLLGPQGIGAMIIKDELSERISPIVRGGTGSISDSLDMPDFLPDKFEPGTLNLPGIIGLNEALRFVIHETPDKIKEHELRLSGKFIDAVKSIRGVRIAGPEGTDRRVGVISLDFEEMDNAEAAYALETGYGIMTRCGLHCAPMAHKTLGTFPQGTVRFSFGYFNSDEDLKMALKAVDEVASQRI